MKIIEQHISDFEKVLNRNGFDGDFQTDQAFSGTAGLSLTAYLCSFDEGGSSAPFMAKMTTCSDQRNEGGAYTLCHFQVGFDLLQGFLVKSMAVERRAADHSVITQMDDCLFENGLFAPRTMANEFVNPGMNKVPENIDLLIAELHQCFISKGFASDKFWVNPFGPTDFKSALQEHFKRSQSPYFPVPLQTRLSQWTEHLDCQFDIDHTIAGRLIIPQVQIYQIGNKGVLDQKNCIRLNDVSELPTKVSLSKIFDAPRCKVSERKVWRMSL